MDRDEMKRRVSRLTAICEFFSKKLSNDAVALFIESTQDIPAEKFDAGISKATRECRFMPSPAEFRELACGIPLMPRASEEIAAFRARWGNDRV